MKTTRLLPALLVTVLLARADVLPPAQDTSSLKGKLTLITGRATSLAVTATRKGFVRFNLANLPADVLSTDIANARLRFYFTSAATPGDLAIHIVTAAWDEKIAALEPGVDETAIADLPVESVVGKKFVEVDVTDTVREWIDAPDTNFGFAFLASGTTSVLIGAKEGSGSGYPCELEVEIDRGATVVDGGVGATQLADGAVTTAKIAVGAVGSTQLASGLTLGGTITIGGGIALPTTLDASTGVITQNGTRLMHTFGTQNFFVGQAAGNFTMTGAYNTASGFAAFQNNTTGADNTASGYAALQANTTGFGNTASGFLALYLNTSGDQNTAVGHQALRFNTGGSANTASGFEALYSNTTGGLNTASGFHALYSNTTGSVKYCQRFAGALFQHDGQ